MSYPGVGYIGAAVTLILTLAYSYARRRPSIPLPPGPKPWPIIGNLFDMPTTFEWEQYASWGREFNSSMVHLCVAGQSIIVLNSYDDCIELLEKRSKLYSSRPPLAMAMDVMKMHYNMALLPYGDEWRARRRLVHGMMHKTASTQYHPLELRATHSFLRAMLTAGDDDLESELRHMAGIVILGAAYGLDIPTKDDPHVLEAEAALRIITDVSMPGNYLVNVLPFLKHLPEWFPGADFQRKAREWRDLVQYVIEKPFHEVKQRTTPLMPSFSSIALEKGVEDDIIRDAAGTMYNAGTDTTIITTRAQAELDNILGPLQTSSGSLGRLPEMSDEAQLPFVTALVLETFRWKAVTPIAVPHMYSGEKPDIYKSYAIPRGSIVIPNVWAMLRDESTYPDPDVFKPERFLNADGTLDTNVRNPDEIAFGFGRRICPGRRMAYASTWIMVASILRIYSVEKVKGPDGAFIEPSYEWRSGLLLCVMPTNFVADTSDKLLVYQPAKA